MKTITNATFDEERALYASKSLRLVGCTFDGPADGESALKESGDIVADGCFFNLRYPFWHVKRLKINGSVMTEHCRAALWYSSGVEIEKSKLHGIKAVRECSGVSLNECDIVSPEFGWFSHELVMNDCTAESEYFMLGASELEFTSVRMKGKYSFQYIENAVFDGCTFDTKDAFWHAKNVKVKNSIVKGEYLAWYCENVTFENCTIIGTQPLCYCKGLRLINCKMPECDLAFEKSEVHAQLTEGIKSIKNPLAGRIELPSAQKVIIDGQEYQAQIIFTEEK